MKTAVRQKALILEPLLKHWTTVEPLVVLFLKKHWHLTVVAPVKMKSMLERYIHSELVQANLNFLEDSTANQVKAMLLQKYDCVIMSNRYITTKMPKWKLRSFVKMLALKLILLVFLTFKLRQPVLIVSSHLVKGVSDYSAKTNSRLLAFLGKFVWDLAIEKMDAVNVYSSLVRDAMGELIDRPILVAPNAIYRYSNGSSHDSKPESKINIVIPGRIDHRRRYYDWVEQIDSKLIDRLSITLLGVAQTAADRLVIDKFNELGFEQSSLVTGDFISFEDFDRTIETADVLLAPLKPLQCKDSSIDRNLGSLFDAVRYGKPILVPSHVPIDPALRGNIFQYKDDTHLAEMIDQIVEEESFRDQLAKKAYANSERFAPDNLDYLYELQDLSLSRN